MEKVAKAKARKAKGRAEARAKANTNKNKGKGKGHTSTGNNNSWNNGWMQKKGPIGQKGSGKGGQNGGNNKGKRKSGERKSTSLERLFMVLMRGATAVDWLLMADFDRLRSMAYQYNHNDRTANHPSKEIPWPIIWTLTRYHKKHIFYSTARPKLKDLAEDLRLAETKMKWRWFFRNEPNDEGKK